MRNFIIAAVCVLGLLGCAHGVDTAGETDAGEMDVGDTPEAGMIDSGSETSTTYDASWDGGAGGFDLGAPETDPMIYMGGNVMTAPINVYVIWYGSWTGSAVPAVMTDFLSHVGQSNWFKINTAYYQQSGVTYDAGTRGLTSQRKVMLTRHKSNERRQANLVLDGGVPEGSVDSGAGSDAGLGPKIYVDGGVSVVKSINVDYTYGNSITDDDVVSIITDAITAKQLPLDPDGAYYVFTSGDVSEGSFYGGNFCFDFCGWHNNTSISNTDIKYIYIGDPSSCLENCTPESEYQQYGFSQSPNGSWSADGMVSVAGHELSEVASDPSPSTTPAWQDDFGYETADKCAWTYGQPYVTSNDSVANVHISDRDYMIQQLWVLDNDGGRCDLHQ